MLLTIPHLTFSLIDSLLALVLYGDRNSVGFLSVFRQYRAFRLAEYGVASFTAEYAHVLQLLEMLFLFADFASFGALNPLFYIAAPLTVANALLLIPAIFRIIDARFEAQKVVNRMVLQGKAPRMPTTFELLWWRPAFDIVNLIFNFGTKTTSGIVYATEEELRTDRGSSMAYKRLRNSLDIITPIGARSGSNRPVLLYVHGGAWQFGDKRYPSSPLLPDLARAGFVVVNTNYRLSRGSAPGVFPEHLIDIKRCIRWVKANIDKYGGDPNFVAISGGSAGGHLATLAALTANVPLFQPGFESVNTSVQACCPFYPVVDVTNVTGSNNPNFERFFRQVVAGNEHDMDWLREHASPLTMVKASKNVPPFLVFHGERDTLVPVPTVRAFVKEFESTQRRVPIFYLEFAGTHHAFDILRGPRAHLASFVGRIFLDEVYRKYKSGGQRLGSA
ncbi:Alpha/Beta hydrolase protein [Hyaloraphidium curvatum]|nr:Alpha/Beta hydrolase protein [Hyaloraphidium curvatum]